MEYKIGFIGAGNMAGAIINGVTAAGMLAPARIAVYDVRAEQREDFAARGFAVCESASALARACAYVFLAVKPQNFADVFSEIRAAALPETVFVSIAAGISAAYIKDGLGFDAKVIRVMPNTPLLIGCGASALSRVAPTSDAEFAYVKSVFAAAGAVEEIAPDKMNEVIPLNGSSPAYIYRFAQIFVERAVASGLDAETANRLFCNSLIGSARMMLEAGKTHQQLIDMVTSPGGTTFKGLEALRRCGFEQALNECFDDTVQRARELGK